MGSVFLPRVSSSIICSMHCSSHIFISFMNCILTSFDIFVLFSYLHVHAPLGILFHFTNGKLKSPLRIIVGSGLCVFLKKILSHLIFYQTPSFLFLVVCTPLYLLFVILGCLLQPSPH